MQEAAPSLPRKASFGLLAAGLVLASIEVTVRLAADEPAASGDAPPALVEAVREMGWEPNPADRRLLREDGETLWSLVPGFQGEVPSYVEGGQPWTVRIGPHGYRGEPPIEPRPGVRVACIGNSCTFGLLVDQGETWPERLGEILSLRSDRPVEVLNFAVPGFTSEQGLSVLRSDVLPADPDLVVLSFGFNDTWPARESDRDRIARQKSVASRIRRGMMKSSSARLLERFVGRALDHVTGPAEKRYGARGTRVSDERTAENLGEMIQSIRRTGRRAMLLSLDFPRGERTEALSMVADELDLPFVDARSEFRKGWESQALPELVEELIPVGADRSAAATRTITFEVAVPSHLPRPITLVGNRGAFGGDLPGALLLPDDGAGADRRAGDGIHSVSVELPRLGETRYLFRCGPPSGTWTGLESTVACRRWKPGDPVPERVSFGRLPLMAEPIHPSALGCRAIAKLVARSIEEQGLLGPVR
ncbi:MAG: hypothetical protein CME06_03895 [Gemmatimonadetes bacterium]|nr:hypothetical protein [Gemmatimonadota bacterium]